MKGTKEEDESDVPAQASAGWVDLGLCSAAEGRYPTGENAVQHAAFLLDLISGSNKIEGVSLVNLGFVSAVEAYLTWERLFQQAVIPFD